jgi:hypothetical protein
MLVKGMLRLCHLLVIRLSCSAHLCAQLHFPLLSQHRVCNVLLDPSLAGELFSLEFARVARTFLSAGLVCVGTRALARPFAPLCSEAERDNAAQWTEARGTRKLRRNN